MKNTIIPLISLLIISFIIPHNEPLGRYLWCYLWCLPILTLLILMLFFKQKNKTITNEPVPLKIILIAKCLNFVLLAFYLGIATMLFEAFPQARSFNYLVNILYIILTSNVILQSPGYRICKIKIRNETFILKLKILMNNFIVISPLYLVALKFRFNIPEKILKPLVESMFFINTINIFSRFFIIKKESALEKILGLEYVSQKQSNEETINK